MCQLVICGVQRAMVRPSLLISGGQDSFWRSSASRVGVSERESGTVNFVDAAHGFLSLDPPMEVGGLGVDRRGKCL